MTWLTTTQSQLQHAFKRASPRLYHQVLTQTRRFSRGFWMKLFLIAILSTIFIFYPLIDNNNKQSSTSNNDHELTADLLSTNDNKQVQVSLLAACRNRHDTLQKAFQSWMTVRGIDEIILVDWGSTPTLLSTDDLETIRSTVKNFKLVRVESVHNWKLSWAYNLGFKFVTGKILLKVDCDTFLFPEFLDGHPILSAMDVLSDEEEARHYSSSGQTSSSSKHDSSVLPSKIYYAGDWKLAKSQGDENMEHLNGVFMTWSANFKSVGGYDERIQSYGWDDSDLYQRFNNRLGLYMKHWKSHLIHHIPHSASLRNAFISSSGSTSQTDEVDGGTFIDARYETQKHRVLMRQPGFTLWDDSFEKTQYSLRRVMDHFIVARIASTPQPPLESLFTPEQLHLAELPALKKRFTELGISWEHMKTLPLQYLKKTMVSYATGKRLFVIYPQFGLGARLQTLASAMVIARDTGRRLRVIWIPDIHCQARLHDLFDDIAVHGLLKESIEIWDGFEQAEYAAPHFDSYNYMDQRGGKPGKIQYIQASSLNHIFVKSAIPLIHSSVSPKSMGSVMRGWKAVARVKELIAKVLEDDDMRGNEFIGVHIRTGNPRFELQELPWDLFTRKNWDSLYAARNMAHVDNFIDVIRDEQRLSNKSSTQQYFFTTDTKSNLDDIAIAFGNDILSHSFQEPCYDRSVNCLQIALAELYILSHASVLLGSPMSAFTQVAELLSRGNKLSARLAGVDFPGDIHSVSRIPKHRVQYVVSESDNMQKLISSISAIKRAGIDTHVSMIQQTKSSSHEALKNLVTELKSVSVKDYSFLNKHVAFKSVPQFDQIIRDSRYFLKIGLIADALKFSTHSMVLSPQTIVCNHTRITELFNTNNTDILISKPIIVESITNATTVEPTDTTLYTWEKDYEPYNADILFLTATPATLRFLERWEAGYVSSLCLGFYTNDVRIRSRFRDIDACALSYAFYKSSARLRMGVIENVAVMKSGAERQSVDIVIADGEMEYRQVCDGVMPFSAEEIPSRIPISSPQPPPPPPPPPKRVNDAISNDEWANIM